MLKFLTVLFHFAKDVGINETSIMETIKKNKILTFALLMMILQFITSLYLVDQAHSRMLNAIEYREFVKDLKAIISQQRSDLEQLNNLYKSNISNPDTDKDDNVSITEGLDSLSKRRTVLPDELKSVDEHSKSEEGE